MSGADRRSLAQVERVSSLMLRRLKRTFPDDYDKRCMYAALGMRSLLVAAGMDARLRAGDFCALVVSKDEERAALQGFRGNQANSEYSHYWIETPHLLIDLGLHLLPRASRFPAAPMPILCWAKTAPLPLALRYRTLAEFPAELIMQFPVGDIADRVGGFLDDIQRRGLQDAGAGTARIWHLTGAAELERAARRDIWAAGVLRFEQEIDPSTLPF